MFEGFGQNDAPRNAVQLMTIHASKGLEFKNVFVLGVNDRYLPHARGEMNEELRLFYVAATRAEEYLLLVSPVGIDFYGKELNPSSFLSIAMGETEF
jgi:superfamily I DNA/RNA helicase